MSLSIHRCRCVRLLVAFLAAFATFAASVASAQDAKAAKATEDKAADATSDDYLRTTAVLLLAGAFDQVTGWHPHNYYLYHDGRHDRWRYLPWDLDVGFSEVAFGKIQVLADWNPGGPVCLQTGSTRGTTSSVMPLAGPVCEQTGPPGRETASVILEKHFEPQRLCAKIDANYALIKDDLATDPFPHRRVTHPGEENYEDIVASIKQFVRKRYTTAHEQLETPGPRPKMTRPPDGPPQQLMAKIQRVQRAAEALQHSGGDVRPIQKLMQQVGPLLQKAQMDKAEKLIDEALKLAGEE